MSSQRKPWPNFLDVLDFKHKLTRDANQSTILFVDIGGSKGHQSIALRHRYPHLSGQVILQDLIYIIAQVQSDLLPGFERIETNEHDMFKPQSIKGKLQNITCLEHNMLSCYFILADLFIAGARVYYFRHVFYDWPNDECKRILGNLEDCMVKGSVVLIDKIVVYEVGATWRATLGNITMAVCLAAKERTEAEWRALAASSRIKIQKVLKYRQELEEWVMVHVIDWFGDVQCIAGARDRV